MVHWSILALSSRRVPPRWGSSPTERMGTGLLPSFLSLPLTRLENGFRQVSFLSLLRLKNDFWQIWHSISLSVPTKPRKTEWTEIFGNFPYSLQNHTRQNRWGFAGFTLYFFATLHKQLADLPNMDAKKAANLFQTYCLYVPL